MSLSSVPMVGRWIFALALSALVAGFVDGCAGEPIDAGTGSSVEALTSYTRDQVISRAEQWVSARLQYCQSANHARDYDTACSTYCSRTNNSAWDPYRSDCSGLVSWAWGLPPPGRVTTQFAPFVTDISHVITASSLQPGDAVNNSDHIMLFKHWNTVNHSATFIEEPGCSTTPDYAHEFTSTVTLSGNQIHVAYNGMTFTAIRYDHIIDSCPAHCDGTAVVDSHCVRTACGTGNTCSTAGSMAPHCVSLECVTSATETPVAHDICTSSGQIAACSSAGDLGRAMACPSGETCRAESGTAQCVAASTGGDGGATTQDGGVRDGGVRDGGANDGGANDGGANDGGDAATDAREGDVHVADADASEGGDGSMGAGMRGSCAAAPGRVGGSANVFAVLALAGGFAWRRSRRRAAKT